jgi:hypothetical protein
VLIEELLDKVAIDTRGAIWKDSVLSYYLMTIQRLPKKKSSNNAQTLMKEEIKVELFMLQNASTISNH